MAKLTKPATYQVVHKEINATLDKVTGQLHFDPKDYGAVYGDVSAASANVAVIRDMAEKLGGDLNLMITGHLHLSSINLNDAIMVNNLSIKGKGDAAIHLQGGYYFMLQRLASAYVDDVAIIANDTRSRFVLTAVDVDTKICNLVSRRCTFKGKLVMFQPRTAKGDPRTSDTGVDHILVTDFVADGVTGPLFDIQNVKYKSAIFVRYNVHNLKGTLINDGIANDHPFERFVSYAKELFVIEDYKILNDDDFFGDADIPGYVTNCVTEANIVYNNNAYIKGLKVRVNGNVVYDNYYGAGRVLESNVVVEDVMAFNDQVVMPFKIKSSKAFQSIGKKWLYRRGYLKEMQAIDPTLTLAGVKGDFLSIETEDWHETPEGMKDAATRFITIDTAEIELLALGRDQNRPTSPSMGNFSVTNSRFQGFGSGFSIFLSAALYGHNHHQQLVFRGNRVSTPEADVRAMILSVGSQEGGSGATAIIDVSDNIIECKTGRLLQLGTALQYNNTGLNICDNKVFGKDEASISNYVITPNMDTSNISGNYLQANMVNGGSYHNGVKMAEGTGVYVAKSPVVFAEWYSGAQANINAGTYCFDVRGDAGVWEHHEITLAFSKGVSTSATFTSTSDKVTKTTGTDNGTFALKSTEGSGFALDIVVSNDSIKLQSKSSVSQRYEFRLFKRSRGS